MCVVLFVFMFFFSSRRRHTRLQGDWSSDVCSSDLVRNAARTSPPRWSPSTTRSARSEEHTSELQSPCNLVCRLLLEKKKTETFTSLHLRPATAPASVVIPHAYA